MRIVGHFAQHRRRAEHEAAGDEGGGHRLLRRLVDLDAVRGDADEAVVLELGRMADDDRLAGERVGRRVGRRIGGQHRLRRRAARELGQRPVVPAGREAHMTVDLQAIVFALPQRLAMVACPAGAEAVMRIERDGARLVGAWRGDEEAVLVLRLHELPAQADKDPFGRARLLEQVLHRPLALGVAVGGDVDEDAGLGHGGPNLAKSGGVRLPPSSREGGRRCLAYQPSESWPWPSPPLEPLLAPLLAPWSLLELWSPLEPWSPL